MLTHARITAVALLGAAALLTTACGGDDKADDAREQASSAMSQAQEVQSQALSQASEVQSQALSQLDDITQDLGDLTEAVPPVTETTVESGDASVPEVSIPEVSIPEVSIPDVSIPDVSIPDVSIPDVSIPDVSVPTEVDTAAAADIIAPEDVKAAVEEASGVTLVEQPGAAAGQGAAYANLQTMIADGQAIYLYVLTDPQAAQLFQQFVPAIPGGGDTSSTIVHKNVIAVYSSFGETNKAKEVEAAVKAL
jgi:hypothetical protein